MNNNQQGFSKTNNQYQQQGGYQGNVNPNQGGYMPNYYNQQPNQYYNQQNNPYGGGQYYNANPYQNQSYGMGGYMNNQSYPNQQAKSQDKIQLNYGCLKPKTKEEVSVLK